MMESEEEIICSRCGAPLATDPYRDEKRSGAKKNQEDPNQRLIDFGAFMASFWTAAASTIIPPLGFAFGILCLVLFARCTYNEGTPMKEKRERTLLENKIKRFMEQEKMEEARKRMEAAEASKKVSE